MKYFVNVLKQFTPAQRLTVLVLLLSFTTVSFLASEYLKTDSCRALIDENLKMHEDFAKISEMLRKQRLQGETMVDSAAAEAPAEPTGGSVPAPAPENGAVMDSILHIAESNSK